MSVKHSDIYTRVIKHLFIIARILPILFLSEVHAEKSFSWPGDRKAAVVLTYDDALASHVEVVLPLLNSRDIKATFYLTGNRPALSGNLNAWREAAEKGHELGNHTLVHPCVRSLPGREWLLGWQALESYTRSQYLSELNLTNILLQAIDGEPGRTFAYPCAEIEVEGESVEELIRPFFVAARHSGDKGLFNPRAFGVDVDSHRSLHMLPAFDASAKSASELIEAAESALAEEQLITFIFHGVGAEYLAVSETAHREFIDYLAKNQTKYWVTTLREAAQFMVRESGKVN